MQAMGNEWPSRPPETRRAEGAVAEKVATRRAGVWWLLCLFAAWSADAGLRYPLPQAAVQDDASMLSPAIRSQLDRELDRYREETGCRLFVVTVDEYPAPSFVTESFTEWWVAWGEERCAVGLYFIEAERKARVLCSPAIRKRLGREEIRGILEGAVFPRFEAGDPEGAVLAGVETLRTALEGELKELPAPLRARPRDVAVGLALLAIAVVSLGAGTVQVLRVLRDRPAKSAP